MDYIEHNLEPGYFSDCNDWYGLNGPGFQYLYGLETYLFPVPSRPIMGPINFLHQSASNFLPYGRTAEADVNHTRPFSCDMTNEWSYVSTPIRLNGGHR